MVRVPISLIPTLLVTSVCWCIIVTSLGVERIRSGLVVVGDSMPRLNELKPKGFPMV